MQKRALLFAGGSFEAEGPQAHLIKGPWDFVVCVDSGARHALLLGIRPDLLVGDFDSITEDDRHRMDGVPKLAFDRDKDKTDTHLAIDWALDQGATEIVIAGGIGSRFDHSLANAQLLVAIQRALRSREGSISPGPSRGGVVTDGRQAVYLLADRLTLSGRAGDALTVIPLSEPCRGLSESGLRWELTDQDLELGNTLTVSNEFTRQIATLSLREGLALVIVGPPE